MWFRSPAGHVYTSQGSPHVLSVDTSIIVFLIVGSDSWEPLKELNIGKCGRDAYLQHRYRQHRHMQHHRRERQTATTGRTYPADFTSFRPPSFRYLIVVEANLCTVQVKIVHRDIPMFTETFGVESITFRFRTFASHMGIIMTGLMLRKGDLSEWNSMQ